MNAFDSQLLTVFQVDANSTLPTTINSIHVLNAPNTREGFLKRIFDPLLKVNNDRPFTLAEAFQQIHLAAEKLQKFGRTLQSPY